MRIEGELIFGGAFGASLDTGGKGDLEKINKKNALFLAMGDKEKCRICAKCQKLKNRKKGVAIK
ncbi:MAG: hypothetical protein IJW29_00375 [Clostridia bacterium]|nr:hypothetical protein [Clostridia bacterium]